MSHKIRENEGRVIFVGKDGVASLMPSAVAAATDRQRAEAERIAKIKAEAAPPEICGPDIQASPARGPFALVHHLTLVPNGKDRHGLDKWEAAPTGYGHRAGIRSADVFDRMVAAARKAKQPWPLTPGQIAMARHYRDLTERHDAGGLTRSRLDGAQRGGDGRDFMDAFLAEGRELAAIHRRIGAGASLEVRRVRPSRRGSRSNILDRVLVDRICLCDQSISAALRAHGWVAKGETRKAALEALSAALDRMIGYRGEKRD